MIHKIELTTEQILYAIENNDFDKDVIGNKKTIVIATQSWCPQWVYMEKWIYKINTEKDVYIYFTVYDNKDYFNDFMRFKEKIWDNYEIPYLRYYLNGEFIEDSNYTNEDRIKKILDL